MNSIKLAILTVDWKLPTNRKYIRREFNRALNKCGIKSDPFYIDIRSPQQNRYVFNHPSSKKWHKDGAKKMNFIVIWTNKFPTLLRERRTKKNITIPTNSIVIFDNNYYRHKPDPRGRESYSRWFIRHFIYPKELPKRFKQRIFIIK